MMFFGDFWKYETIQKVRLAEWKDGDLDWLNSNLKQLNSIEFTSGTRLNTAISFSCLPAAFMKSGNADISDAPTGSRTSEFGCIVYGHGARRIVLLTDYGNCATYIRTIFSATWYSDWKISI